MEERGGGEGEGLHAGGAEAARQGARHDASEAHRPAAARARTGRAWQRPWPRRRGLAGRVPGWTRQPCTCSAEGQGATPWGRGAENEVLHPPNPRN
jgi:hypothetical protein